MADIIMKCIDANSVTAGRAVVGCLPNGDKHTLDPQRAETAPDLTAIETDLTDRFDDPTYYDA